MRTKTSWGNQGGICICSLPIVVYIIKLSKHTIVRIYMTEIPYGNIDLITCIENHLGENQNVMRETTVESVYVPYLLSM